MKKLILATLVASTCSVAHAEIDVNDENASLSYSLGMLLGERFTKRFGDLNYEALMEGLQLAHEGKETQFTMEDAQARLQNFEQAANKEAQMAAAEEGEKYLEENKAREGVKVTESGLQYEVITEGDGPKPTAEDTVSVHYAGTLIDGTEFDSSIARGQPTEFPLKGVIPGWTEGLQLMNTGGKYRFVIPSELAYGQQGAGQAIGPGATLIFEVELLEIK